MASLVTPVIAQVYDRLVSSCTTINQVNRVNIAFEDRVTPTEVRQISRHLRPAAGVGLGLGLAASARLMLEKSGRQVVERLRGRVKVLLLRVVRRRSIPSAGSPEGRLSSSLDPRQRRHYSAWWALKLEKELASTASATMPTKFPGRKNQHEFFRQWRRGEASLFSSATGSSNGPRGLIICVKGNSRRMMMPMPTWLSNLPGEDHDVLALGCPPHKMFVDGVRGFSKTLPETLEAIDVFVAENGYTDVWVMGSSGGTLPALFAGLRIGAKGIFLAGVVDPDVDNWRGFLPRGELARRVGEAVDTAPRHPTEIVLAYGADDEPDTVLAQRLAELVPNARLMPVAHTTHNCLYPLAKRRQLAGILRDFLS